MKNELKKLIEDTISSKKISQNQLAKKLGVSNGTISNILNDHWERINETMITNLLSQLRNKFKLQLIETANFQNVWDTCEKARKYKRLMTIVGREGAGKTVALNQYNDRYPNTYKITCIRLMKPKEFLQEILKSLGVTFTGSLYEMILKIAYELNKKNDPVLLIDEISAMSISHLIYIKDLWDLIENNCGIVLCGQPYFLTNLENAVQKCKIQMPEFYSRISYFVHLKSITRSELKAICKINEIENIDFNSVPNFRVLGNIIKNQKENIL